MGPFSVEENEIDEGDPPTEVDKIVLELMEVMREQLKREMEEELKEDVRKEIYEGFLDHLNRCWTDRYVHEMAHDLTYTLGSWKEQLDADAALAASPSRQRELVIEKLKRSFDLSETPEERSESTSF
ncbi:hypothetical protein TRICI_002668 [Trichomonascus ciferrii]|uniref:Uncharacterized protein n=1 Tax=Trichomonascus ciferrii TaxID=44093 RepID=A0A642VB47_9ASCO|nr:hypothetical protein TRICI_002668 [Trichomonascus ciferrii]